MWALLHRDTAVPVPFVKVSIAKHSGKCIGVSLTYLSKLHYQHISYAILKM